jgi:hypothetical protein
MTAVVQASLPHHVETESKQMNAVGLWISCYSVIIKEAKPEDIKAFFNWIIERYPRVGADSSLGQYWRVLKRHRVRLTGKEMNDDIGKLSFQILL